MNVFLGRGINQQAVSGQPSAYFIQKHRLRYAQAKPLADTRHADS
ncbi:MULTISPECIES: hypothetical protein [Moorena]|nr:MULTISPECIES: hypothetical protein [Moorena]